MKKLCMLFIGLAAVSGHAMENVIATREIATREELEEGLELAGKMFDRIFAQHSILRPEECEWVKEYRKNKPANLFAIQPRKDAFVIKNGEILAFVASHQDDKKPARVILDSVYLGDKQINLEVIPVIFGFIKKSYPDARQWWGTILRKNEPSAELLKSQGFTESKYMDSLHNAAIFQGWKRKVE